MEETTALVPTGDTLALLFDRKTEMGDLTGMWRACGSPAHLELYQWLRNAEQAEFLRALMITENTVLHSVLPERPSNNNWEELRTWSDLIARAAVEAGLLVIRRGRNGGTSGHWQVAARFAGALSPVFAVAWNNYARAYLEGRSGTPIEVQLTEMRADIHHLQHRVKALECPVARTPKALPEPVSAAVLRWADAALVSDARASLLASEAAAHYNAWAERNGAPVLSVTAVSKALVAAGLAYRRHTSAGNRLCGIAPA